MKLYVPDVELTAVLNVEVVVVAAVTPEAITLVTKFSRIVVDEAFPNIFLILA